MVSSTRGEAGQIRSPHVATRRTLGAVREQELRLACQRFGVQRVVCLDHQDGPLEDVDREELTGRIHFEYVGAIQKVQGDNLYPPERMKMDYVLAHTLDHLALLSRDDRSIRAILTPEWMDVLRPRLPKPTGFVGLVLSRSLAFQNASSNAEQVKFVAGQIIFHQGDPADKLYIITKGQVEVLSSDKSGGREIRVA